jgi:hypothetical protein
MIDSFGVWWTGSLSRSLGYLSGIRLGGVFFFFWHKRKSTFIAGSSGGVESAVPCVNKKIKKLKKSAVPWALDAMTASRDGTVHWILMQGTVAAPFIVTFGISEI